MRLLAFLHRLSVNPALVAGLILMPMVVAMGYVADRGHEGLDLGMHLRGSFDAMTAARAPSPASLF